MYLKRMLKLLKINAMFSPSERLLVAIQDGDFDEVLHCLRSGYNIATTLDVDGRTAVGKAAAIGDNEILELLIQACEEPNLEIFQENFTNVGDSEFDTTPDDMDKLEWEDEFSSSSSLFNDTTTTSDNNDSDTTEHISLYIYYAKTFERTGAIIQNITETMSSRLVAQDPHICDTYLMTPLHYAAGYGHVQCVRILLAHGARVDSVNIDGWSAMHLAVEYNEIVCILLEYGGNPNIKTYTSEETVLHIAIKSHYSLVAKMLIQRGNANINATDDNDQTPLICAIVNNQNDIALILLEHGARVNLLDRDEKNAIYYAVMNNNVTLVARLLQHGARICTSYYLLHHCVRSNMQSMAELLVTTHNDSLNVRNKEGITPIMLAIIMKKLDILTYFLRMNVPAILHQNELLMAVQHLDTLAEFKPIARILLTQVECEDNFLKPSCVPVVLDSINCDRSHFICHAPYCQTPLMRAILLHKFDIAAFLLKEGTDVREVCNYHLIKSLRATISSPTSSRAASSYEFMQLLVNAGYKYPCQLFGAAMNSSSSSISDGDRRFDNIMRELCEKPLSLQSLSRLTIRRHLIHTLASSKLCHKRYVNSNESSLCCMIQELDIPSTLRSFLTEFDDCPISRK